MRIDQSPLAHCRRLEGVEEALVLRERTIREQHPQTAVCRGAPSTVNRFCALADDLEPSLRKHPLNPPSVPFAGDDQRGTASNRGQDETPEPGRRPAQGLREAPAADMADDVRSR